MSEMGNHSCLISKSMSGENNSNNNVVCETSSGDSADDAGHDDNGHLGETQFSTWQECSCWWFFKDGVQLLLFSVHAD